MRRFKFYPVIIALLVAMLLTACGWSHHGHGVSRTTTATTTAVRTSFVRGMGCADTACTNAAHHHNCPANCTIPSHYHQCPLDCDVPMHFHNYDSIPEYTSAYFTTHCDGSTAFSMGCIGLECTDPTHYHHCPNGCTEPSHGHFIVVTNDDGSMECLPYTKTFADAQYPTVTIPAAYVPEEIEDLHLTAYAGLKGQTGSVSFWPSNGCCDLNCTDGTHYHYCGAGCTDSLHYHNCASGWGSNAGTGNYSHHGWQHHGGCHS